MRPSRVVLIAVAWVAVVAVASTLVWAVISRAGDNVVSQEPLVATGQASSPPTSPATDTPRTPDSSEPTPSTADRRTWQEYGMLLVAECDGRAIRRVAAQPADGYIVEIKDDGPDELELEFEGREDEEGTHVTVEARCVAGAPEFTSSTEDED